MTNREWLNSLPNKEYVNAVLYKVPAIGKLYNDSVIGLNQWMDEEHFEIRNRQESDNQ